MSTVLIVYGTTHGQTERVVRRMAATLIGSGHAVSTLKGDQLPLDLSLGAYDAFIVADCVRFGRYHSYISAFVRRHITRLNAAPSAFVSVCGAMAGSEPQGLSMARGYIEKFLRQSGWRPWIAQSFAGGLPYTRYNPLTRWMMRMISRRTGRPTDTSRDYDFTDWEAVDQFARHLADLFTGARPVAAAGTTVGSEATPGPLVPVPPAS
jgi:menaquinone-dependent protoporphyrinogen oxidase